MDCTEKIILLLGFLFCFILSSNDVATQGQLRFFKLCKDTERYLVENKECSHAYLDGKVKPLLLESIHQGEIWDNTLKRKGPPVFKMFLVPEVGGYDNLKWIFPLIEYKVCVVIWILRYLTT